MMEAITPRWLVTFLSWVPVEAGTYRVNKVKVTRPGTRTIECSPDEEIDLPEIYVDYEEKPREYTLNAVTHGSRCADPHFGFVPQPARPDPRATASHDREGQRTAGERTG
jgi:hypothetical protein